MIKEQFIDYFKLFKIYDLKKLEKTGQVKIVQDKILMRKILSVEGTVSTQNFTSFSCSNHPNIHFRQQYLYLLAFCEPGKAFTFQITYFLSNKQYRLICSTMYKEQFKRKSDSLFHYQVKMPSDKWTVLVMDLYSLVNWDNSFKHDQDIRLGFRVSSIQIRAHSKIRGMFQSQSLFGPHNLPKDMQLPLRGQQAFFDKYAYFVIGLNITEELKKQIESFKQKSLAYEIQQTERGNLSKKTKKPDNIKPNQKTEQKQSKSQHKSQRKNLTKQKTNLSRQKSIQQKQIKKGPIAGLKKSRAQNSKKEKRTPAENHQQPEAASIDEDLMEEQMMLPPKPAASINIKIEAIQALGVVYENIIACESFLIEPVLLQTHKKITNIYKSRLGKVLTSYVDGSVCLWDTIRKQPLFYFKSELQSIKGLLMDYEQNIIIVGLDKLKRQVIEIVSDQAIIFKQISNFNIKKMRLIAEQTFEMGFISFGYENIRIWTISPNNNIINGYSIYLGKMARNITYNDCCMVQSIAGTYAFVCDSEGYVTKININQKKMEGVVKVDYCGLDHIKIIKYLNNEQKILVCNEKGTIKLLSCVTMESQLQYPLNHRVKNLFLKDNPQDHQVPILLIETFKKTLAELNLVDSTFHFNIRSHYQQISHIEYEKGIHKSTSFSEDKIVTAGGDSTVRIWKLIKVSNQQTVLKEEYEFLINGEAITHICCTPSSKKSGQFVYMITDTNKIRKISISNYQIIKEKASLNDANLSVLSFSINQQGKFLLILCLDQILILDQELQVVHFKDLSNNIASNKVKNTSKIKLSGFNTYKKAFYYEDPHTGVLQFFQMKDLQKPAFCIQNDPSQPFINIEWNNDMIHCITQNEYQLYQQGNLIRVVPFQTFPGPNNQIELHFTAMNYPVLAKSYQVKQTGQFFVQIQLLNKNGMIEKIKMPERISSLKATKPFKSSQFQNQNDWQGQIICSGAQSFGMYALKYTLLNVGESIMTFDSNSVEPQINAISFMDNATVRNMNRNMQTPNMSFISNMRNENMLDISFSQTSKMLPGQKSQISFQNRSQHNNKQGTNPPAQLRKLYEEEEKMFEQCKKAVFGNFFEQNQNIPEIQEKDQQENKQQGENLQQSGKVKIKTFFGIQPQQSLIYQVQSENKRTSSMQKCQLGQFYWDSQQKLINLLTNDFKSLLVHEFTDPSITQRLIHLYSKPNSMCWSYKSNGNDKSAQLMNYFVVCNNSIIKLYNINNRMNFIRSIECQQLMKERHVIFDSFITNCNSFIVALTYKLSSNQQVSKDKKKSQKSQQNKLYIFVIDISTGKIVSSSYRDVKYLPSTKNRFEYEKSVRQSYCLQVNRFTANKKLQFVLKGSAELAFYRVTSMFTLQTLQLEQIYGITKQKTQALTTAIYIKVEGDTFLLVGSQNGSLIIIDSRSGSIALVLMNLFSSSKSTNSPPLVKIEFLQEQKQNNQGDQIIVPSKLIFYTSGCNAIRIITLQNGLNTLINQLQSNSTTILENMSFSNQSISNSSNSHMNLINLDSEITSVSAINNLTQQLVLTKSSTLWLVDFQDNCSIKIFSAHSQRINEAYFLPVSSSNSKQFISCSEDGYVKVTDANKIEQSIEIYKPRKNATCMDIQGKYTICGFKDEIYFYDALNEDAKTITYLGSLQLQNQNVIQVKNIPFSDNYYVLTDKKVYVIYVKRKELTKNVSMLKSQMSVNSHLNKNMGQNSQYHEAKSRGTLQKVLIQIQIQQITSFASTQQTVVSGFLMVKWLQVNVFRPYDEFSLGFRGGKIDTWERKCLKRTLNPLEELANVHQLQYYLIDVYSRKQILQPIIQFISERQYMISLSQLNKIEIRNYKQHSITGQISFSEQSLEGIKTFKYLNLAQNSQSFEPTSTKLTTSKRSQNLNYFNGVSSLKKGPVLLIGDQFGYLNICDMNGLVLQKVKIFSTPIEAIIVNQERSLQSRVVDLLVKSSKFISLLQIIK